MTSNTQITLSPILSQILNDALDHWGPEDCPGVSWRTRLSTEEYQGEDPVAAYIDLAITRMIETLSNRV